MATETRSIEVPEGIKVTLVGEMVAGTEVRLPNGVHRYVDTSILGEFQYLALNLLRETWGTM